MNSGLRAVDTGAREESTSMSKIKSMIRSIPLERPWARFAALGFAEAKRLGFA